jgi:hypothetical protein
MTRLSINCNILFSFLSVVKPTISINGVKQENASWKNVNIYDLPPGQYHIRVSRPWGLMMPIDTCVAETVVNLRDQESAVLNYKLPIMIFLPGSLTLVSQNIDSSLSSAPTTPVKQVSSGPELCPTCKNPIPNKSKICEWCGNSIG